MTVTTPNPRVEPEAAQNNSEKQKLYDNVKGLTLGAVPILLVATILVLANDTVLFRNVVYRGDLLGFLMILISPVLSLVVAAFAFLILSGLTEQQSRSTRIALAVALVLIAFTMPMRFVVWVGPILAIVPFVFRMAQKRRRPRAARTNGKARILTSRKLTGRRLIFTAIAFQLVAGVGGAVSMGINVDPIKIAKSAVIRGLPTEVISMDSGPEPSPIIAHVIQAGDQVTTIVTDDGSVRNLWNETITGRTPCNDRTRWLDRTPAILSLMVLIDWQEATPSCESVHDNPPAPWIRTR
jgi:hypothetical protein